MRGSVGHNLLDRAGDLDWLASSLAAALDARGSLVIVEGPAGIGKTSLLSWISDRGRAAGAAVLRARGSELEQGFEFGVVRQLFEATVVAAAEDERARWSTSAAGLALPLFSPDGHGLPGAQQEYGFLHGLYWLVVHLADRGPLLIVVDDAHWADEPSLRLLAFLHARMDTLPVLAVAATRPGCAMLDELALHPATRTCRPEPLGLDAVTAWLHRSLDSPVAAEFARACAHATGGNPFLVDALIREVRAEGIVPDTAHAAEVTTLSPRAVVTSVLLRLGRLPEEAVRLAEAVAVLETADPAIAASLAGFDRLEADRAVASLVDAGLVVGRHRWTMAHPLVRAAILDQIPGGRQASLHARAGELLAGGDTDAHVVAAHALLAPAPAPWAVDPLRRAARDAVALGAPEPARRYLDRLTREPLPPADAAAAWLELGEAQLALGDRAAESSLERAHREATDADTRVGAAVAIAHLRRYTGLGADAGADAVTILREVRDSVAPGDAPLLARVDGELLACASLSISARLQLLPWIRETVRPPAGAPRNGFEAMCLATLALDGGLDAMPADQVAALAARTMAGASDLPDPRVRTQVMTIAAVAFHMVDRFTDAATILRRLELVTAEAGLAGSQVGVLAQQASLHLRLGELDRAAQTATRAIELDAEASRATSVLPRAAAVLIGVAIERGTPPPARYLTDNIDRDSISFRLLDHARAEWMAAMGHHDAAAAALLAYGQRNRDLGWDGTATAWRSQAAGCLAALGRAEEARTLVEEEVGLARRAGAPRALGIALRAKGCLATGVERRRLLEEACGVHDGSPAVLERAWSYYALGVERREAGDHATARDHLRQAHATAAACGAQRLLALAADQLRSAGGRPTSRPTHRSALTDAEVRVTELAAAGRTNRQIAQILFVTEKTVETHLAHAYRKLGIRSRQELPPAPSRGGTAEP